MNFGESEPFSIRHPYFFRDKTFKFEGLDSATTKEFEESVKNLGANVTEDSFDIFCEKSYAEKNLTVTQLKTKNYYAIDYILESLHAGRALDLKPYRILLEKVPDQSCNCPDAKYILRNGSSCSRYFEEHIQCQACREASSSNETETPSSIDYNLSDPEMPKENNKTKDSTNSGVTLNGINHQVESAAELEESPSLLHLNYFKKPFRNIDNNSDDSKQSCKDKESTTSRNIPLFKQHKRLSDSPNNDSVKKLKSTQLEGGNLTSQSKLDSERDKDVEENDSIAILGNFTTKKVRNSETIVISESESCVEDVEEKEEEVGSRKPLKTIEKKQTKKVIGKIISTDSDSSEVEAPLNRKSTQKESPNKPSNKSPQKQKRLSPNKPSTSSTESPQKQKRLSPNRPSTSSTISPQKQKRLSPNQPSTSSTKSPQKEKKKFYPLFTSNKPSTSSKKSPQKQKGLRLYGSSDSSDVGDLTFSDTNSEDEDNGWWNRLPKPDFSLPIPGKVTGSRGRGETISESERRVMIAFLIKRKLIHRAKSRAESSPWNQCHQEGYLRKRNVETLRSHMVKKILKEIGGYDLPDKYKKQFLSLQ